MSLPTVIQEYFQENKPHCEMLIRPAQSTPAEMVVALRIEDVALVRAVLLEDKIGVVMAVLPAGDMLDFNALSEATQREFDVCDTEKSARIFNACVQDCHPALPSLFNLSAVREKSTADAEFIYVEAGDGHHLLKLSQHIFTQQCSNAVQCSFSVPAKSLHRNEEQLPANVIVDRFLPARFKQRVQETYDLPAMPDIAQEVLRLRVDPHASARELARVVSRDPSLSAHVISWANSPYYGFSGRIHSVEMAIMRVLGFDMVLNLALGISVGRSLNVPRNGPLGLRAFWVQAVLTAELAEKLCGLVKSPQRPQRGLVYLAGLLHNIGHLLLGHIFPPQFYLINRYVAANPHIPVSEIEYFLMGVTHEELGAWLLQSWHMPDELITSARCHHAEHLNHEHSLYPHLVLLAGRLLRRLNIGDASSTQLPVNVLSALNLTEVDLINELTRIQDSRRELEDMANRLVA